MTGTKAGGLKAAKTNLERYGADFYKIQSAKGGRNGHTGGFAANRELASLVGAKGGRISSRAEKKEPLEERRRREAERELSEKEIENLSFIERLFGAKHG